MTQSRDRIWHGINHNGQPLFNVGILADGTLHNPNGYDEALVREAVRRADERWHARCSAAARKAAITRQRRLEKRIHEIARELKDNRWKMRGPRPNCFVCGKGFSDGESKARGIGPECWQRILRAVEVISHGTSQQPPAA
jgi:hypothetical protein